MLFNIKCNETDRAYININLSLMPFNIKCNETDRAYININLSLMVMGGYSHMKNIFQ